MSPLMVESAGSKEDVFAEETAVVSVILAEDVEVKVGFIFVIVDLKSPTIELVTFKMEVRVSELGFASPFKEDSSIFSDSENERVSALEVEYESEEETE